ncbi:enoyl-CoA hydratase [Ponticaulis sp.]|uniref:enoyl-CoA hydratase n=1 Tax=Ponticaulis sp. TaxID=2020902 RepID=UPI000B74A421|nr:enoyl-CoA hydratase [Ponticaulis sp.]MAI89265.1 enoyl-CoA hydratase [Ponticaulis sp.]OUY01322.1 MAG: enoyl-CoA hydratase [Hyphomonadaceae bacterium TMED5]
MAYETLLIEIHDQTGIIRLNRPDDLNALNNTLMDELTAAVDEFEDNDDIGCIIITGSKKAFAAGADIKELKAYDFVSAYKQDLITRNWERVSRCRKPVIAAVAGYALGGGCELAMMCDFIIAAENAKFGQPEINLGVLPGAGGTQRLTRFVGKSKAMDMCLTGRMIDAEEAERCGLVARVVAPDVLLEEAKKVASIITSKSLPVAMMVKESVNAAYETTLSQGIMTERRLFHSVFATEDKDEGMEAFIEKRDPHFRNK